VGAIGCGYWGPNLIRNLAELPESELVAVADLSQPRLDHMRTRYGEIETTTTDYRDLFNLGLDAVVISTPPETHYAIAADCLSNGLHVLVEKPLTTSSETARQLVALSEKHDRVLMVGHTFEYNPAVRALRNLVDEGELGSLHYIDAVRVGLGLYHPHLNVVWDLAPHDISILLYLLGERPISVSAHGTACVEPSVEDVAYLSLRFPSGIMSHVRLSWLDPRKTRRITVVGSKKMAVYDDMKGEEKIKVYDKSVSAYKQTDSFGEFQFDYHHGAVTSPHVIFEEPLRVECSHFLASIVSGNRPLSDGWSGLRVVEIIEAAQESLRQNGAVIELEVSPFEAGPAAASGRMRRPINLREAQ
jgi:predicted dehydrogenase